MPANQNNPIRKDASAVAGKPLPVVAGASSRRRGIGRWRAAVLILVQLLIAIHIAHWMSRGETLSPLEPSEAMQFSKQGVINAGLIFFALTILSTLVLGRWFCGWACHLVALQDLCLWLMRKAHIRPRPLNSFLLATVPLLAFLYMFIGPLLYRVWPQVPSPASTLKLTTTDFWATFPGWLPAVLTFVVCGFACVYFLGAKGFCTYACPYGAAFAVVDRLSTMRIRVTDACVQCGTCSTVCTSNVQVASEVHKHRAVLDPGCMKCLDCVHACPSGALYYGVGAPALWSDRKGASRGTGPSRALLSYWIPTALFVFVSLLVFVGSDVQKVYLYRSSDLLICGLQTAFALAILAVFGRASDARGALSIREEAAAAFVFLASMLIFRGAGTFGAFLFALGASGILAYAAIQTARLLRRRDVSLPGIPISAGGELRRAGYGFLAVVAIGFGLTVYAGIDRFDAVRTQRDILTVLPFIERELAAGRATPEQIDKAIALYREMSRTTLDELDAAMNLGLLLTARGRYAEARQAFERAVTQHPNDARLLTNFGILEITAGDAEAAARRFSEAIDADSALPQPREALAETYRQSGRLREAADQYDALINLQPNNLDARMNLAWCCSRIGEFDRAILHLEAVQSAAPGNSEIAAALEQVRKLAAENDAIAPDDSNP